MAGHVLFSSSSVREARKLQRQYDVVRGQELARTLKHASTQARTRTHAHTHTHTHNGQHLSVHLEVSALLRGRTGLPVRCLHRQRHEGSTNSRGAHQLHLQFRILLAPLIYRYR
jgi:hypothetical protein